MPRGSTTVSSRSEPSGSSSSGNANTSISVEEEGQKEVGDAISAVDKEMDQDDSSGAEEGEDGNARVTRRLQKTVFRQKRLLEVGELVGEKGKPSQIVQDAHLSFRANVLAIPTIRSIRISRSVWNAKVFTKRLLGQLSRACSNSDELEEATNENGTPSMDDVETAITFFHTLVEDFLGECPAGLVPDLSTVYGAISTVAAKTKRAKSPEASQEARRAKDKDRELPQVVRKLQAAEMDANIDPTMQRVGELNAGIQEMFLAHDRKPICLMRLLIDRRSFQKTVQNFFCFSFLLKDDAVRVYLDEAQLPVCTPVRLLHETGADEPIGEGQNGEEMQIEEVPDPTLNRAEENKFQTIMMNLTEASWKDLVQTFYAQAV